MKLKFPFGEYDFKPADLKDFLIAEKAIRERICDVAITMAKAIGVWRSDLCLSGDLSFDEEEVRVSFVYASCGQGGGMSDEDNLEFPAEFLFLSEAELANMMTPEWCKREKSYIDKTRAWRERRKRWEGHPACEISEDPSADEEPCLGSLEEKSLSL